MANEQNLIPFTSDQNREEAKKNGRKGGIKSGEVRRQRKAMKEQMELLLSLPFNLTDSKGNAVVDTLEFLGIDKDQIDNQMAMNIALWQTAINSNNRQQVQAIKEIRDITKDNKENQTDLNSVKEVLVKIREVAKNDANTD